MTLPFRCEDCGGVIVLTTDEALAIYQSRISLCQACIDSMEDDRDAYQRMDEEDGRPPCRFFERVLEHAGRPAGEVSDG